MIGEVSRWWARASVFCGLLLGSFPGLATPVLSLVISEVFYDRAGSDNGFEWVELFNGTPAVVNLLGFSLGFAGNDYASATLGLSGSVDAGDYFVVGGPLSDTANGSPLYDLVINFSPDIQNSGSTADGVALFDVPQPQLTAATIPLDAVIYGSANVNQLIDASGLVAPPMVGDAPAGASIERLSTSEWGISTQANPGVGRLNTAALPLPATLWLFAVGLCFLSLTWLARIPHPQGRELAM